MSGEIIALIPRLVARLGDHLRNDTVQWNGTLYDAGAVLDATPTSIVSEALLTQPDTAQDWWDAVVNRWPGAAVDILDRLGGQGHPANDVAVGSRAAAHHHQRAKRTSNRTSGARPQTGRLSLVSSTASHAVMMMAAKLTVEEIDDVIDTLIGFLEQRHNVAHP